METWLAVNGVPEDELAAMAAASLGIIRRVGARKPDILLEGGELLHWGALRLEVRWVPGHSAGLICLYDAESEILVSSDHVLQRISPHVGLHAQSLGSPLDDYLGSLRSVRELPVRQVLPGHGEPFADLTGRVDEIIAHHERRNERILAVLARPMTAYEVASRLSWRGSQTGWSLLEPFQRRMAVTETIAHLEYLHGHGHVSKDTDRGQAVYRRDHT
jgi:glyoxylase-like metal-dependent hydrolase (beta-lactamase superfamily II)